MKHNRLTNVPSKLRTGCSLVQRIFNISCLSFKEPEQFKLISSVSYRQTNGRTDISNYTYNTEKGTVAFFYLICNHMNNCETLEAMNNQIFLCESSPNFERPKKYAWIYAGS